MQHINNRISVTEKGGRHLKNKLIKVKDKKEKKKKKKKESI